MAELTPLFMDLSGVYSGDELGLPYRDLIGEGIVAAADLAVSAGAGNSVNIAAGSCWVVGDTNATRQPCYRCLNDAIINKGINPDGANPRRILVVAQIVDEGFAGSGRLWRIDTIHGTPAAVPVVPATPASALVLANILVPAAAASSAAYTFTDLRKQAFVGGGGVSGFSGARVINTAAIVVAHNAVVPLTFNAETYDTHDYHSLTTNPDLLTAPVAGYYDVLASIAWAGVAGALRELRLVRVSDATIFALSDVPTTPGGFAVHHAAGTINLAAGDAVRAQAYQDTGAPLNVVYAPAYSPVLQIKRA